MKLLFSIKRRYTSLPSLNLHYPQTNEPKILHFCKSGDLTHALNLLNSLDSTKLSNKPFIYASLLQTSTKLGSFSPGLQIHAHLIKSGLETDRFVGNSLLALYFKLGTDFLVTRKVFDGLYYRDVISWTSMITGYVKVDKSNKAIELFGEMLDFGVEPNDFTLSAVIKACSDLRDVILGRCFHCVVVIRGFDSNHVIGSALIDMYGKNYGVEDARRMFDELLEPDAICWTSVISAFTRNDMYDKALGFFHLMQRRFGLAPDSFTFGTVLTACGNLGRLKQGKEVHAKVFTSGFSGNVVVESSLVDMYGKCGFVNESQLVFDGMRVRNSVSWSALLGGYCQNGDFESVIRIFREVGEADLYSFGTVLRACAGLAAVRRGKEVHCQYVRRGGWRDVIVESALVDLYAKCGCIDFAHRIFAKMSVRNLITWNSMICGLAQNGGGQEALKMFDDMIKEGTKPDYITFIGVLFACSHTGLVDEGRTYFTSMINEYAVKPGVEHYSCMVDLLGRAGLLEEAELLIENADCRDDSSLWEVLLGACATCRNSDTAERIAKKTMKLAPDYHLSYIYLANIYKAIGRWDDAVNVRKLMEDRGVQKMPGKSWISGDRNTTSHLNASGVG
ncbi:pentatricopeptide repeat-containing protein At1g03540 [Mercurialis annua]|uniref:pentatricopeptide repeat-containing protein At1g03540 n=1 Tax=Mercurialis annua TaxID=3986 RepID=UPI0021602FCB|nr:pentatricopeptide repeat-containing protein At1g03540 [Mercurialis annua]